jgi:hypothetical protein
MAEECWTLERIGGGRRAVIGNGGRELCVVAFLGPRGLAADLLCGAGPADAEIRGSGLASPEYEVNLRGGERLRLVGTPPRLEVRSTRRAPSDLHLEDHADGTRTATWRVDGGILGILHLWPQSGGVPWRLEIPAFGEPLRSLAVLVAASSLARECDGP